MFAHVVLLSCFTVRGEEQAQGGMSPMSYIFSVHVSRVSVLCAQSVDTVPKNSSAYALEELRFVGCLWSCFMHTGSVRT